MNIESLRKQWLKYSNEFTTSEVIEVEKHIMMASKVGLLINEVDRLNNKIKLLDQVIIELKK